MMEELPENYRSGYVAIIGFPNAGKSTLLNALLNIKLSIISKKPQTTRRRVLGILNRDIYQIVFVDTPGILRPRYALQKKMMEYVRSALCDADLILLIVDAAAKRHPVDLDLKHLNPSKKPLILLLNKIDLMSKGEVLPLIETYKDFYPFETIIPISALQADGIDRLEKEMVERLPLGYPFYPPDVITDHPERFFVAEFIREKIFERFYQEIPYSTEVEIEIFEERQNRPDYILATIYVERKSQKGMLIGKGGEAIKSIGTAARKEIEEFLGRRVFLELRVKVNEDWRRNEIKLRRLGF
ncbi:MAG TPA: GTPase Era [Calditrichaeota bacterium]|nr:GTPase Era [Calditrichota bacterium]